MLHELWEDPASGAQFLFVVAGPHGDDARATLSDAARLTWTVDAESHFEAMTKYYEHQGWGLYSSDFPDEDARTYAERGWTT